ncbi:MAG: DNA cytosine methyltransferase [Clostridiales bacterium]|nr:DNA cytosine methyltransferase [Clostridiales bacterium]
MEQIRIIREMREKTNECFPKIVIWENVSAAISSNNGDDFFCVLQEFCKLMAERIPTFRPEGWSNAGEILGESCSIAWRLFDAQYWGVPQRRRRIFLVADFGGQRAGEILFKSESLRRHLTPSTAPWKRFTAKTESSIEESSRNRTTAGGNSVTSTLTAGYSSNWNGNAGAYDGDNFVFEKSSDNVLCVATQQANAEIMVDKCPTLTAANGTSGSNKPYVVLPESEEEKPIAFEPGASSRLGGHVWEDVTGTLTSQMGDNQMSVVTKEKPIVYGFCSMSSNSMKSDNPDSGIYEADVSKTLDTNGLNPTCNQGGNAVVEEPVYCIQGNCIDRADTAGCNGKDWREDISYTLTAMDRPAVAYGLHENQRDEMRMIEEKSPCLSTGGGKCGQGLPAIMIEEEDAPAVLCGSDTYVAAFAYQQGGSMPTLPYGEKISPPLLSSQKTAVLIDNHPADSRVEIAKDGVCQTLSARMGTGGGNVPLVMESQPDTEPVFDELPLTMTCGCYSQWNEDRVATLIARDYKDPQIVVKPKSIVRRLTPLECERLQGYPDNWTASESDSARYKALGNSIALLCVDYIMSGIADVLNKDIYMNNNIKAHIQLHGISALLLL